MIAGIISLLEISRKIERIQMTKIVYRTFVGGNIVDTYNIGLARVHPAFVFTDYIKPVAFPSTTVNFDFNEIYQMAFWGCEFVHIPTTRHSFPSPLQFTNVKFNSHANSRTEPQSNHPSIIYGQTFDGRGFGIGSSGHGVVVKEKGIYVIYASLTKSVSCNNELLPSVFSRIGYYASFLRDKMNVIHQLSPK